jgi:hypothetical protein
MPTNLGAAIYGLVTIGALLAAESAQRETYAETVGAVLITLVIYWFAHSYAEFASYRLEEHKRIELDDLGRTMRRQLPILVGASLPLFTLLFEWAVGASLEGAVTAAVWTAVATIVVIEIIAGLRARQSGRALFVQIAIGALLGGLIVGLKLILH